MQTKQEKKARKDNRPPLTPLAIDAVPEAAASPTQEAERGEDEIIERAERELEGKFESWATPHV